MNEIFSGKKILTGLNNENTEPGSKGYFANTLYELKTMISSDGSVTELDRYDYGTMQFFAVGHPIGYNFYCEVVEKEEDMPTDEDFIEELMKFTGLDDELCKELFGKLKERRENFFYDIESKDDVRDVRSLIKQSFCDEEELAKSFAEDEGLPFGIEDFVDFYGYGRFLIEHDSNDYVELSDGRIFELD